jgi:hypothetical protein
MELPKDIEALGMKALTELHNELNPDHPVKRFADRGAALKRVRPMWMAEVARRAAEAPAVKARRGAGGIGETIRGLIRQGYSNAAIREKLGLNGTKRAYFPGWYRAEMKRKGRGAA